MKSVLHLKVSFSEEDKGYIATCKEYPGLSGFAEDKLNSVDELTTAINLAIESEKEEAIIPKESGELWQLDDGEEIMNYFLFRSQSIEKQLTFKSASGFCNGKEPSDKIIHNQNGWTRLHPPVEDEKVERIVIEGVEWFEDDGTGVVFPDAGEYEWKGLLNKTMTMILIPKEDK